MSTVDVFTVCDIMCHKNIQTGIYCIMYKIEETTIGKGLVATMDIPRNTEIIRLDDGEMTNIRTQYSIEIDEGIYSLHASAIYINHSFTPNCVVLFRKLISCKPVKKGEQITLYYPQHESEISHPFVDAETGMEVKM